MKIAVLTSSRADYGIYLPLLHALKADPEMELFLVAFGSHTSAYYGKTIDRILHDGFEVFHTIDSFSEDDSAFGVSKSYAGTVDAFADFWSANPDFDWVICLGDRFEMSAAVQACIPFQLKIAHLYAGDTTLGAIDNIYRHQITLASKLHFVSIPEYSRKVAELTGFSDTATVIGSLSLLDLEHTPLDTPEEFFEKWRISLDRKYLLVTVHPETVHFDRNEAYSKILEQALSECVNHFDLVVTMPNADTNGQVYRNVFQDLHRRFGNRVHLIENFGTKSYFTAMKHAALVVGNSSSGIMEAASFGKYVLNIGDRQKGRIAPENVIHIPFDEKQICDAVFQYESRIFEGKNPFVVENGVGLIIERLKNYK